jgi:hypothetical protein
MLQYIRDEAHRFAQHYHHILRRKSVMDEQVEQGRRPPTRRKKATASSTENPHTTLPSLPILNGDAERAQPPEVIAPVDADDVDSRADTADGS